MSLVFGYIAVWGFKYSKGFPINIPLQALSLGVALFTFGVLIGYALQEPILDVLLLKTAGSGAQKGGPTVWWAAMVCGYALAIDGVIGCIISGTMAIRRKLGL